MELDRRSFIKTGVALAVGSVTGCATTSSGPESLVFKQNSDALLRNAVSAGDIPGVVAAVTTSSGTVYEAAFGERVLGQGAAMDLDTVM